jgi:hypothetical protein
MVPMPSSSIGPRCVDSITVSCGTRRVKARLADHCQLPCRRLEHSLAEEARRWLYRKFVGWTLTSKPLSVRAKCPKLGISRLGRTGFRGRF